jgi:hypothetical protein
MYKDTHIPICILYTYAYMNTHQGPWAVLCIHMYTYTYSQTHIHGHSQVGEAPVGGSMLIKLVDFGSALYNSAWHPPLVGTMHYR